MFYCHSVCLEVLKISGQNYNFILSKSLMYLSVVVSMCLPSSFSQKHKHCFQTILLLRLWLRLLFGIVLLYWIMSLVLHHIQAFWSRKNYELVMHPCLCIYRLDIDVAFVVISLNIHFISWGEAILKLLLTNENISKDNAKRSKLAMNTP